MSPIKEWRTSAGLTQEQAAARLGVHRITYLRLEHFTRGIGPKLARKVAEVTMQTPGEVLADYKTWGSR